MSPGTYRLVESPREHRFAERFFGRFRRVGLAAVLDDLNRVGARSDVPGEAAAEGMTWQRRDVTTRWWWPQGITTSADAYGPGPSAGTFEGRPVVVVSWYGHGKLGRALLGSRLSVVDLSDADAPRYRHVLLVEPHTWFGFHRLRPVRVHAGGIVWYGDHLFVAGSSRGLRVFRLDDIVRVRNRARTKGYRYVLPQHASYAAATASGVRRMTYSFMSLDRAGEEDHLVVGEYGRAGGHHRLMRYALDRATQLLRRDEGADAEPAELFERQVPRMQGGAIVEGTWMVTASVGEGRPGDLWVGRPDHFVRLTGVLPSGPEDITYWPQRRQLWSVTEWPGRRWLYAIDVDSWLTKAQSADDETAADGPIG